MSAASPIEFFFDVGSPYSYLASTQVPGIEERTGRAVIWRPFLLGGVFKLAGNDVPKGAGKKSVYMLSDLRRWADQYEVPFVFSSHFPQNTLAAQRALIAAARLFGSDSVPAFAAGLFQAVWVHDKNVSYGDEIAAAATAAGLDVQKINAEFKSQENKDALKEATAEAVERGAFGAPSFFADGNLFWGNDRIDSMVINLDNA